MKKLLIFLILGMVCHITYGQTPHGFNYQAVARDGLGNSIPNTSLIVKIGLLTDTVNNIYVWEEQHQVKTNPAGVFNLVVGTGSRTQGSAASFSDIEWGSIQLFVRIKITYQSVERIMGSAKLWSVPYSLVSEETKGMAAGSKLAVVGENDQSSDALFEVKRKDGQTVFAVYNDAVNVYVPDQAAGKKAKGGFAIGGFDNAKGFSQQYFSVTPDSIRLYINDLPAKASKGGFAIGGFNEAKGVEKKYMSLFGANTIDTITNASQIMWYPNKEAFLAGRIEILSPDSVGRNSFSTGYKTKAIGNYSHAMGYESIARGDYSTAIGRSAVAGINSFALGNLSKALGNDSYAIGSYAEANGEKSFAIGSFGLNDDGSPNPDRATWTTGYYSLAFGMGAQATNLGAMSLGINSTASGGQSVAIGFGTNATNQFATAMGYKASANGLKSIAIGSYYHLTFNKLVWEFNAAAQKWTIINVPVEVDKQTSADGDFSIAIGNGNYSNNGGLSLGTNNNALAFGSVALGHSNEAVKEFSFAAGFSNYANGIKSFTLGENLNAQSANSFVIGAFNEIEGTTK